MYEYTVSTCPIEQICKWSSWDYYDTFGALVFYDCVLTIDLPPFKKGDVLNRIYYRFGDGTIECVEEGSNYKYVYPLYIKLGDPIKMELEKTYADQEEEDRKAYYE